MPRRSNEFQRLIYLIQHQIAQDATVTESKMLPDRETGSLVEVDVVVEGSFAGALLTVGMECTAEKRPATVEWVREMIQKHDALPVDKTVLVSRSGFTSEAKAKADARGAEALTLVDAEARDWERWMGSVKGLRYATLTIHPEQVLAATRSALHGSLMPHSLIKEADKPAASSLDAYVKGMSDKVLPQVWRGWATRDQARRNEPLSFTLNWECPPGTIIITEPGIAPQELLGVQVKARVEAIDAPFSASVSKFREHDVLHGEVESIETDTGPGRLVVSLIAQEGQISSGAALLKEPGKQGWRLLPMSLPKREEDESR